MDKTIRPEGLNPFAIIRDSVRIALHSGRLWAVTFLIYPVMVPAFVLSAGIGAVTSYLMFSGMGLGTLDFLRPLEGLPAGAWAAYLLITLILLTISSLLSWGIQAAMIRLADAAADGKPLSIVDSLRLGRQRWISLAKLALTLGLVLQAVGVIPPFVALLAGKNSSLGFTLVQASQTFLSPFSIIVGILVFLLTMSVALEDTRPRMALTRVWRVIRSGWWGFLLAYLFQGLLALAVAFLFAAVLAIVALILMLGTLTNSAAETILAAVICLIASPAGLLLLTFILVFSTVFFTLVYRGAAKAAPAE
jgi:hypothetical protein